MDNKSFFPNAITQDMILPGVIKPRHLVVNSQKGDIFYNNGSNFTKLSIGAEGQKLTVRNGIPVWE